MSEADGAPPPPWVPRPATAQRPPSTAASRASSRSGTASSRRSERSDGNRSARSAGAGVIRSVSVPQLPLRSSSGRVPTPYPASESAYFDMPLGNLPHYNIPGYTGHIPGKGAENVLGASHSRANALALAACSRRGEPPFEDDFARRTNPYGLLNKRRGAEVPGYTGYIPARHPSSIFGVTFADANAMAVQVQREQALHRVHRPPVPSSAGPLCWTGNAAAYQAMEDLARA